MQTPAFAMSVYDPTEGWMESDAQSELDTARTIIAERGKRLTRIYALAVSVDDDDTEVRLRLVLWDIERLSR